MACSDTRSASVFSLARLSCFVAVAEELHFGRAAERLHMTQPPLSRQIQQLENELGVQLIDRTTRTVTLTPAGVAFLPDARRILQPAEGAAQTVKRIPAGDLGTVVVGFTAASAHAVLPRLLETAREKLPDVKLDLREMVTAAQIEGLMTGELDLGMARPPLKRPGLVSRPLLHEQLIAALPKAHPMAALGRQLTLNDLDDQDVIMYSPVQARYFNELLISTFTIRWSDTPLCAVRDAGAHDAGVGALGHRHRAGAGVGGDAAPRRCGVPVDRSVPGETGGAGRGVAGRQFESRAASFAERRVAPAGMDDGRSGRGRRGPVTC
jgi:DNA-binding transcriptional LysR family regulator